MKNENRKIIYDGITISVRALTFFIAIGLLLLGVLMAYGFFEGNKAEPDSAFAEDKTVINNDKINQRFIDKKCEWYYNKNIVVAAKTP